MEYMERYGKNLVHIAPYPSVLSVDGFRDAEKSVRA
jgi:hypothetical protein